MYRMEQRHQKSAMQLGCFMFMLFLIPMGLWHFGSWLLMASAPPLGQTTKTIIALDSSELYTWRICPKGRRCYDKFRLCVKSSQLPSPDSNYCFISTTPISRELHQLQSGTLASLRIAPDFDSGRRKILRFWEMNVEGRPSLSYLRIATEHDEDKNDRLIGSLVMLGFSSAAAIFYRWARRRARRY